MPGLHGEIREFQSTPSVWRATIKATSGQLIAEIISIHALRVEGDLCRAFVFRYAGVISIHALRVEGDTP